jgi:hypothetical protein
LRIPNPAVSTNPPVAENGRMGNRLMSRFI